MPGKECLQKYPTFPADPANLSPTNYVALKVSAEAVEIAGSFDAKAVAQVLRSHTFDMMLGTRGFDEKGDVTGIEMWAGTAGRMGRWWRRRPRNCRRQRSQYGGLFFFSVFLYQQKKLGRGLGKSAAKIG